MVGLISLVDGYCFVKTKSDAIKVLKYLQKIQTPHNVVKGITFFIDYDLILAGYESPAIKICLLARKIDVNVIIIKETSQVLGNIVRNVTTHRVHLNAVAVKDGEEDMVLSAK